MKDKALAAGCPFFKEETGCPLAFRSGACPLKEKVSFFNAKLPVEFSLGLIDSSNFVLVFFKYMDHPLGN